MQVTINRNALIPGMGIHVQSTSWIGRNIRWALTKMQKRLCKLNGLPFDPAKPVWGNHDGIMIYRKDRWYVGEALPQGSVLTPLENYEAEIAKGTAKVRFVFPLAASERDGVNVAAYWLMFIAGTPYDYAAYPRLIVKSLVMDWEYSNVPLFRWIGRKSAGWRWAHWCTEGESLAWRGCGLDPFGSNNPTPLTVEHRVGWLPQHPGDEVTLADWTEKVCGDSPNKDAAHAAERHV
jgi:hypothetical protein